MTEQKRKEALKRIRHEIVKGIIKLSIIFILFYILLNIL